MLNDANPQQRPLTAGGNKPFSFGAASSKQQISGFQIREKENHMPMHMQKVKVSEMPLVSYSQLEHQYGTDVERICADHEKLVEMILEEEEELIGSHR